MTQRDTKTKIGKRKTVFTGALYTVSQARIVLLSGRTGILETISRHPTVDIVAIHDDDKILLNCEYRPKYKKRVWRLPGGTVEKGETWRAAAERELQEETGFKAKRLTLFHTVHMGQTIDWPRRAYLGEGLIPSKLPNDDEEDIRIEFLTLKEAMRLIERGEIRHDFTEYLIWKLFLKKKLK
ncbi:MAG: NUDIX hydrolase [Patescibacteria group bacterium]